MASRILLLTAALVCNLAAADQGLDEASNTTLPTLPEASSPSAADGFSNVTQHTQVGASQGRPANLFYPANCSKGMSASCPLVMVLHAFGSNGTFHSHYLRVSDKQEDYGFALLTPDGTLNSKGFRFWNAEACCNNEDAEVDDVGYLKSILKEAQQLLNVDGVYIIGHSNGGNMGAMIACRTGLVRGLVSIAGFDLPTQCSPPHPLSVTLVHGTLDNIVLYETSETALQGWMAVDRCPEKASPSTPALARDYDCDVSRPIGAAGYLDEWRDVNCALPGNETQVTRYGPCADGTEVEFWRMEGAGHVPSFNEHFTQDMLTTLLHDSLKSRAAAAKGAEPPTRRRLRG